MNNQLPPELRPKNSRDLIKPSRALTILEAIFLILMTIAISLSSFYFGMRYEKEHCEFINRQEVIFKK